MVDGAFDPIHPGHLAYFHVARSFGAPLLVNLCPDRYTATKHPILLPAEDRAVLLNELGLVSYVHVSDKPTVDVLHQLQPKWYVKGEDWRDQLPDDQIAACVQHGTTIAYAKTEQRSSTALLKQFQPDVEAFERLALSQKPAEKPWEPTAAVPYDFESRKRAEGKHPELIKEVFQPKKVLDAGCGPDAHLVEMLKWLAVDVRGCDIQINEARPRRWTFKADISDPDEFDSEYGTLSDGSFDLVISREVGEHQTLVQLRKTVTNLCRASSRFVYMTMRLNLSPAHLLDVRESDDLDPTHITLPPKDLVRLLFTLEGFKARRDLEARLDHQGQGRCLVYERVA